MLLSITLSSAVSKSRQLGKHGSWNRRNAAVGSKKPMTEEEDARDLLAVLRSFE